MRIFKFGGASVKDAEGVRNVYKIVKNGLDKPLVIVVSAMGKVTNSLELIAKNAFAGKLYQKDLDKLLQLHYDICHELFQGIPVEVENWAVQLSETLKTPPKSWVQFYDQVIPFGELISSSIVYHSLTTQMDCLWLDARTCVKTNSFFTEANVDWQLTEHFIKRDISKKLENGPVITQGFIGSDLTGKTTTLGREGSDYTGAIFAYCLNAESLTVWKDVPGLLNADPKKFPQAELFDELSFQEVTELTFYGAKVIHPKTIRPLAQKNIPLLVKSFLEPDGTGTRIYDHEKIATRHCFVFKENQVVVTLRVKDNSFMDEKKLVKVFQAMTHVNIKINLMHNSALTFTFCMDDNTEKLEGLKAYLASDFQVLYNAGIHLATIKNYNADSFVLLPPMGEVILEQKTRNNYQVLYRPK